VPRIARSFSLLLIAKLTLPLSAALPELSSIEPIEFDEKTQRVVAKGDARLDFQNTRVRADRITYYREYSLADAFGNVAISRDGYRLIADRLNFDVENNVFAVDIIRTGQWPYYMSGATGGGTFEDASIRGATLHYGNPGRYGLSVSANEIQQLNDEAGSQQVRIEGATFRVGNVPFFYLPGYTYHFNSAPYFIDLSGGSDSELGVYLQSTTLFPITPWLRAGANLDYYSERGGLVGPVAQYVYDSANQKILGAITTGYIDDQGDTGVDSFLRPIDAARGFAEWRHQHHIGERLAITAIASYWSDSEVTRDFREDYFNNNQRPDSFFEGVYAGDNYFVSAFARFRPNNFQIIQERLPEVRFDLLPVPILNTGVYHRFSASFVQLKEDFGSLSPWITTASESDRLDLSYRIERPIELTDWLTLTPLAGARLTHYENQNIDSNTLAAFNNAYANPSDSATLMDDQFTREIYEVGFDLVARAYATYPTINKTWDINGLRHLVRPVLRYRYYSDPDALNEIAAIDRTAFDLNRPTLDMSDLRNVDSIPETHLTRLGVENLFQTRAKGYGSRTLAELNFYQDILFEKSASYDGNEENTFNASWVELVLTPAPWLKFDLASRFKTESLTLEEVRSRTTIKSGEIWELGLSSDLLNNQIDQYRLDFIYRINERYSFLSDAYFDAESGQITRTRVGLHTRIGSTWEVIYAITFRKDALRESDVEFTIRLSLSDM
jgi:LPS-assembly protein